MLSQVEFFEIATFFEQLKALHGPEFVNATLKRHKELSKVLTEYEKEYIKRIESNITGE